MPVNVFHGARDRVYPFKFAGRIEVVQLMGGNPSHPNVAEGWLRTKLGLDGEALNRAVEEVMADRGISSDEAISEVSALRHLIGFLRDPDEDGAIYIRGYQLKAALKEAASVARAAKNLSSRMGDTNKGTQAFVAEHIIVVEDRLYVGKYDRAGRIYNVTEPDGIRQSFPKNQRTGQTGIQNAEFVMNAVIDFTVITDWPFSREEWETIWLTGGYQGIGASRSQGFGRYDITRWDPIKTK